MKSALKSLLQRREYGLLALIILIAAIVSAFDADFLQPNNLRDILTRAAPTAIVACGVMLVVVTAEIDISVGSLQALLAAVLGTMISTRHGDLSVWIGAPATLLLGAVIGLFTGALVAFGRIPSIIVTLGLLYTLRGASTLTMGGETIRGFPEGLAQWTKYGVFGLPLGIWLAALVALITAAIIHWLPLGRQIYAVGSDASSARIVGLPERRLKLFVFAYTGLLTGLATIVEVPRYPMLESGFGTGFELLVVTCVVVGGVSISGGRGKLTGVLLAVLLMTMIRPVLTYLDVGEAVEKWERAIQGLFILLAVVGDSLPTPTCRRRQIGNTVC